MEKVKQYILQQVANQQLTKQAAIGYIREIAEAEQSHPREALQGAYAIIGMGCRFPSVNSYEEFWSLLEQGGDAVHPFPAHRVRDVVMARDDIYHQFHGASLRLGGYLERIDLFNPAYFQLTPAEAKAMEPGQRLFLEVVWEAIEDAGYTKDKLNGSRTGVFVGHSAEHSYKQLLGTNEPDAAVGNLSAMLPARVAYLLNLRGPSLAIDTTCSSSLVALNQACRSIEAGEADMAIVGGVSVILLPVMDGESSMGNEAADGRCKAFDASADGTNVGEGVSAILIKRLEDAVQDRDVIHAVIRGSAVNSDGRSNGITAPNPKAQTDVLLRAWSNAGVDPSTITYIEAHGTGTKLGDPIEIQALTEAFKQHTQQTRFCAIGSVKTNIGHLDAAAGLAGLIKTVMCLKHKKLPASLHYRQANPLIPFQQSAVYVNDALTAWEGKEHPRRAGVSSFGISGTNAHVVLEEAPVPAHTGSADQEVYLFTLSAKNDKSLVDTLHRYKQYLDSGHEGAIGDICYTANACRDHHPHRIAIVAASRQELSSKIAAVCVTRDDYEEVLQSMEKNGIHYAAADEQRMLDLERQKVQVDPGAMSEAIRCYLAGYAIDWEHYYRQAAYRKLPLPVYAFDRKRYWPKLEAQRHPTQGTSTADDLYQLSWLEKPLSSSGEGDWQPDDEWLVFAASDALSEAVIRELRLRKQRVIKVAAGHDYHSHDKDHYIVNLHDRNHYRRVVESIGAARMSRMRGMLHLWQSVEEDASLASLRQVEQSQQAGVFSLWYLIKAFKPMELRAGFSMHIVTAYAFYLKDAQTKLFPTRSAVHGLAKVISQEFPKIEAFALDLDAGSSSSEQLARHVIRELSLAGQQRDDLAMYRNERRYTQVLGRVKPELAAVEGQPMPVKEGGVYVIAGAGYLGVQVAQHFAKQARVKLALMNRSPLPAREEWEAVLRRHDESSRLFSQLSAFQEMEQSGSELLLLQADLTDPASLQSALEQVRRRFGRIDGVIFAIKEIYGMRIEEMQDTLFESAVMSKVKGIWLLDEYTKQDSLDFFVNFSSISSIMGGPKNSDCTTVNLFLDVYGDYRNLQGRPTVTMNLTEILTGDKHEYLIKDTMIPPLVYERFIACFDTVLRMKAPMVIISEFDLQVMKKLLPIIKIRFSDAMLQEIEQADAISLGAGSTLPALDTWSMEQLNDTLYGIWHEVLGFEEIAPESNFFDIGGTSLSAVKMVRLINQELFAGFEIADLYSYPSISAMAAYLKSRGTEEENTSTAQSSHDLMDVLGNLEQEDISIEDAMKMISRLKTS